MMNIFINFQTFSIDIMDNKIFDVFFLMKLTNNQLGVIFNLHL